MDSSMDETRDMMDRFLDAELPDAEQAQFFAAMSAAPELRREFQQSLLIRESLRADIAPPPPQLRAAVAAAVAAVLSAPVAHPAARTLSAAKLWTGGALCALFGSAATFLALNVLPPSPPPAPETASRETASPLRQRPVAPAGDRGGSSGDPAATERGSSPEPVRRNADDTLLPDNGEVMPPRPVHTMTAARNGTDAETARRATGMQLRNGGGDTARASGMAATSGEPVSGHPVVNPATGAHTPRQAETPVPARETLAFRLELRALAMRSFPDVQLPGLVDPPVNNASLGVYHDLDGWNSLGVEAGQETFLQRYTLETKGCISTIDQNWLGVWIGAGYQHSFGGFAMLPALQPFLRVVAGGTEIGPLGRLSAGLRLALSPRFALVAAAEGSVLVYRQDAATFTTRKLGASGGLDLRF